MVKTVTIQDIFRMEPRVRKIIDGELAKDRENPWETYEAIKGEISDLVGYWAEREELQSAQAYGVVIEYVCDRLEA